MANIFDYLAWRGDLSFGQAPFNPVDAMIFCQLSYLPFDAIVPSPADDSGITVTEAAKIFIRKQEKDELGGDIIFRDDPGFLQVLGSTIRFRDCLLYRYVNHIDEEQEKQFSAVCINTGEFTFLAYRGTDVSLVGWKEDMNMSFIDGVPSQLEAVSYLENTAKQIKGNLILGGHSKGGNLAVYAASSAPEKIRKKIRHIYSFDAPGFHHRIIQSGGFREIKEKISLYIPQSSVVGLLFEHGKDFIVIKSSQSGILQHEMYTWELTYDDMVRLDTITRSSRFVDKTLREWIGGMDHEHREIFIDAMYTILNATQAKSVLDLGSDWFKASRKMIQTLGNIDDDTKKVIRRTIAALFEAARNNFSALLPYRVPKNRQGGAALPL
ncbi:MAG: DUF2974 domain-containing protein [Treponema sp.]|nr:DUF2974 domain-containing protein [Treponema sp.]